MVAPERTHRLVLNLYRSLMRMAHNFDKTIPITQNPVMIIMKDHEVHTSVTAAVREHFKTASVLKDSVSINDHIKTAFDNLRVLNRFYRPSLAWMGVLEKNKNLNMENVMLTISSFYGPAPNRAETVSKLDALSERVRQLYTQEEVAPEGKDQTNRVEEILSAISKVLFQEKGYSIVTSRVRRLSPEDYLLPYLLSKNESTAVVVMGLYYALAQREGLDLGTATYSNLTFLQYPKHSSTRKFTEEDIFVEVSTGKIYKGTKEAAAMALAIAKKPSTEVAEWATYDTSSLMKSMIHKLTEYNEIWKDHLVIVNELYKPEAEKPEKPNVTNTPKQPSSPSSASTTSTSTSSSTTTKSTPPTPRQSVKYSPTKTTTSSSSTSSTSKASPTEAKQAETAPQQSSTFGSFFKPFFSLWSSSSSASAEKLQMNEEKKEKKEEKKENKPSWLKNKPRGNRKW